MVFDTASAASYALGSAGQTLTLGTAGNALTINAAVAADQLVNANLALSATGNYTFTNNSATNGLAIAGGVIARQGMRFMTTLVLIAEFLDEPERLGPALDALTRAHARVGVRAAHFAPMGSALLVTLGETLGPEFTCRLQEAWRAAYDHFAGEMIARGGFT